jgi:hypothetical protein
MAPVAIMAVSAAMSAYGQYQQGQAAAAEGEAAQGMAEYNAKLQEREAQQIEAKTAYDQRREAAAADRRMSSLRAGFGASGIVSTEGTPLLIQATQAAESEMDNLMIGYEGQQQAQASRSGASLSRLEGDIARQKGRNQRTGSFIGAGSTLLSGFGSMGSSGGGGGGSTGSQNGVLTMHG